MKDVIDNCDLIEKMQNALALHKIILNEEGVPIDYEYIYINSAFEELTGLKKDSTIGKRVTELIPDIRKSSFDWIGYYGNIALKEIEDERVQYFDIWNRWYKIHSYSPKKEYFVTVFSDITDIKMLEKKAKEQNDFLNTILNNIDEAIYVQDAITGKYLYANPIIYNILGIQPEELYVDATKWHELADVDKEYLKDKFSINNKIKEINENGVFKAEVKLNKDNEDKWIRIKALPILDDEGNITRIVGIVHDVTEEKKLHIELEKMAMFDMLTEIYNRRAFYVKVKEIIERIKRESGNLTFVMADIDKFKRINDTYGHDVGDMVLKHFAKTLKSKIREYDLLARFGGEEFIIVLNMDEDMAFKRVEEIRRSIEEGEIVANDTIIKYTASFGLSQLKEEDNSQIEKVIKRADDALYMSKNNGRNRVTKI